MANSKISALTSATTPLAGTEVLPIVQSGATVKVANNDLRPKQIQSNATSGVLQVIGPAAAATRIMTTPDANFTAARTDAAQSFTGNQTLSTGNLVQGTAGQGVNFTANTPAAGMTSQLLNWYEEGTWTPTLIGGTTAGSYTLNTVYARYTRIGRQVTVNARFDVTVGSIGTGTAKFGGLPFAKSATQFIAGTVLTSSVTYAALVISLSIQAWTSGSSTDFAIAGIRSGTTPSDLDISGIVTGSIFYMTFTYFV
jgi:hypothetical protein